MRIAFLTNEFIIEKPDGGGLGNYLNRITRALLDLGHQPEIFVSRIKPNTPDTIDFDGVRVHHVEPVRNRLYWWFKRFDKRFLKSPWGGPTEYISVSLSLARAFERRHSEAPFDIVQSTNCGATGLFVRKISGRRHIARLSSIRELTFALDGLLNGLGARSIVWLEWKAIRQAERVYAPSKFVADYCRKNKGIKANVLRPPMFMESALACKAPITLPSRYLIHFGSIGAVKGSDVLAEALLIAWQEAPDLTMLWAGPERVPGEFSRYTDLWGDSASKVYWMGSLPKPQLYSVLKRAQAAVLPSRVDNLPNTVIESLMLSVPVIGSAGASIDELVEPGLSGTLVPIGDARALAKALLDVWNGTTPWANGSFCKPQSLAQLAPAKAAAQLLSFAGFKA